MFVYGVSYLESEIEVCNNFSIRIPEGWCYQPNNKAGEKESVIEIFKPETRPIGYTNGKFWTSEDIEKASVLNFVYLEESNVFKEAYALEIEKQSALLNAKMQELLEKCSKEASNINLEVKTTIGNRTYSHEFGGGRNNFHRTYKLVKEAPFLSVGYYSMGVLGKTVYNIVLLANDRIYVCVAARFQSENDKYNEQVLDKILSSIRVINLDENQKNVVEKLRKERERAEKEKALAKKLADAKAKAEKDAKDKAQKEEEKRKLAIEVEEWNKEKDKVESQRAEAKEKRTVQIKENLNSRIKVLGEELLKKQKEIREESDKIAEEIKSAENELASLSALRFMRKKELNDLIVVKKNALTTLQDNAKEASVNCQRDIADSRKRAEDELNNLDAQLKQDFPLRQNPEVVYQKKLAAEEEAKKEAERRKNDPTLHAFDEIVRVLKETNEDGLSLSEIQSRSDYLAGMTTSRINQVIKLYLQNGKDPCPNPNPVFYRFVEDKTAKFCYRGK